MSMRMGKTILTVANRVPASLLSPSMVGDLMKQMAAVVDRIDPQAAAQRVSALREDHAGITPDALANLLIKNKCIQAGAIGAVTSGASMVPGLGTLLSMTFGAAADIGMTFKLQAELVLEIAAAYDHPLGAAEKSRVVMLVTGIGVGGNQLLTEAGKRVAERATERLAQKSVAKAIPVLGVAASGGTNILFTYIIGRRAQACFSLGPEAVGDWAESVRAVTGMDERVLATWLAEAADQAWHLVGDRVGMAADIAVVAGGAAGKLALVGAGVLGATAVQLGHRAVPKLSAAANAIAGLGQTLGRGVSSRASPAGETLSASRKGMVKRVGHAAPPAEPAGSPDD
jgi:hypothetical protein